MRWLVIACEYRVRLTILRLCYSLLTLGRISLCLDDIFEEILDFCDVFEKG